MSGTSMDGLDLAHVHLTETESGKWDFSINASVTIPYGDKWRLRLSKLRHQNSLIFHKTDKYYGHWIGDQINEFIDANNLEVDLIASHGHTIFHQPDNGLTVQIGDGNAIHAVTDLPVVTNFRAIDVILGGEGAPISAIADQYIFSDYEICLNIGGFANLSAKKGDGRIAYDICPANILLNRIAREFGQEYDEGGAIAERGNIDYDLLGNLNDIEYYHQKGPKTLGREWINRNFWYKVRETKISKEDKMKTLVDHIAVQIANAIEDNIGEGSAYKKVYVTGGGAFNNTLIDHLKSHTDVEIVIPDEQTVKFKEALAFALLGILRVQNKENIFSSVTGAVRNSVSGSLYGDFSKIA